jgi:D-tyrosyl-tRNA(Tyr) deacylase
MKALLQRVSEAGVEVAGATVGEIGAGLLVLLGVETADGEAEAEQLARKVAQLRIFEDQAGKMNLSVLDAGGEVLAVSQFTLCADTGRGNRPGFSGAARPEAAEPLYRHFVRALEGHGLRVATGTFQAEMAVRLVNDGPVTIWLETPPRR